MVTRSSSPAGTDRPVTGSRQTSPPFDRRAFETILGRMVVTGTPLMPAIGPETPDRTCFTARASANGAGCEFPCLKGRTPSNHQRLALAGAVEAGRSGIVQLRELVLGAAPVLDRDDTLLEIRVKVPAKGQPLVYLSVADLAPAPKQGVLIPTLGQRLATALGRIGDLDPGTELFQIQTEAVIAADAAQAYRLWAAFRMPKLFESRRRHRDEPERIIQVIDARPLRRGLAEIG